MLKKIIFVIAFILSTFFYGQVYAENLVEVYRNSSGFNLNVDKDSIIFNDDYSNVQVILVSYTPNDKNYKCLSYRTLFSFNTKSYMCTHFFVMDKDDNLRMLSKEEAPPSEGWQILHSDTPMYEAYEYLLFYRNSIFMKYKNK